MRVHRVGSVCVSLVRGGGGEGERVRGADAASPPAGSAGTPEGRGSLLQDDGIGVVDLPVRAYEEEEEEDESEGEWPSSERKEVPSEWEKVVREDEEGE